MEEALEQSSKKAEKAAALPSCESRYNQGYYCVVKGVTRERDIIAVSFEVLGDGSLGPLQVLAIKLAISNLRI